MIMVREKGKSKGQAILLSHAILVGFSVLLVLVVVFAFNGIRTDYQDFVGQNELEQTCFVVKAAMEKVYRDSENNYISPSNTTYGKIRVSLKERIADLNYRIIFENKTAFINTRPPVELNFSCKIGLNASYSGTTTGGITDISYTEYNNGTKQLLVERVF